MNPNGLQVSTPADTTIVMTRTFNAPRRLVWEAMLTPDKMRRWMLPPPGWTMTACECDARVGGALRVVFEDENSDSATTLRGVFTEVISHERAVHTESMEMNGTPIASLVETHEFAETSGITTMRITQVHQSKDARDGALASGQGEGMEACFKQLEALLARPA
jgi:uncharacterized protein YndB with AHSA1/START domain